MDSYELPKSAPGRGMLNVTGILFIIFGGLSVYVFYINIIVAGGVSLISLAFLAQAGFSMFVGIYAFIHSTHMAKSSKIRKFLIFQMALLFLPIIIIFLVPWQTFSSAGLLMPIMFWGIPVPITALVGAQKNVRFYKLIARQTADANYFADEVKIETQNFLPSAPGKGILNVCGILFMIFGSLSALVCVFGIFEDVRMGIGIDIIALAYLAQAIFSIFVGIYAKANSSHLAKSSNIRIMLILQIVLLILPFFLMFPVAQQAFSSVTLFAPMMFWGTAVPIVALVGAQKNVRAHKQEITPKG